MVKDDPARACRNCGRMQPQSLLNKEGRCETCGTSDTPERAADPSEVGPHGAPKGRAAKESADADGDAGATDGEGTNAEDQG
jgi:predicted ATP-dependent serine protease